jgi:hypothetical protein
VTRRNSNPPRLRIDAALIHRIDTAQTGVTATPICYTSTTPPIQFGYSL